MVTMQRWIMGLAVLAAAGIGCRKVSVGDSASVSEPGSSGNISAVSPILSAGDATDRLKTLSEAMKPEHLGAIGDLITAGADVNVFNKNGLTPLMVASGLGYTEIARLLIDAGADVNSKTHLMGMDFTPLRIARQWNHPDIADLLKAHGASE